MSVPEIEEMHKSGEFFLKTKRFKINGKKIETPRKILSSTLDKISESIIIKDENVKGINEVYRQFNKSKLFNMKQYSSIERDFLNSITKPIELSFSNTNINFLLLKYDTRTDAEKKAKSRISNTPTTQEVTYLLDILDNNYNDFIIPPIMPYLTGEQYINFLNSFFELNESFRNKTIAGLIPSFLSRDEQFNILDYYIKKHCKIFIYDLYGSSPDKHYSSINMLMRESMTYEKEIKEKTFFIATNVRFGRPHRNTPIAPAKDLLSFYSGFDCFGKAHVQKIVFDIGENGKPPIIEPPIPRLLNIEDYGYYVTNNYEILQNKLTYERENLINRTTGLKQEEQEKMSNVLNTLNHGLEAIRIRDKLLNNEMISPYLESKNELPKQYVEELRDLYRSSLQLTLF